MVDPRAQNARGYSQDSSGMVTGVQLVYMPYPNSRYELIQAALIDERAALGTTVARTFVQDKHSLAMVAVCWLAWPWGGWEPGRMFSNKAKPGNANYPYEHVVSNGYSPPNLGPLAIYIGEMGDSAGLPVSDVIGGLGLPYNRHVGYQFTFRERGAVVAPGNDDMTEVLVKLDRIELMVSAIRSKFSA